MSPSDLHPWPHSPCNPFLLYVGEAYLLLMNQLWQKLQDVIPKIKL